MKKAIVVFSILVFFLSCAKVDVFEKNVSFKEHSWAGSEKPTITFNIEDTVSLYNVYIVLRHTDAYNYNNIWVRCTVTGPGIPDKRTQQYELTLATNKDGWLVPGMDDIYEHRIVIQNQTRFTKPGEYTFSFEQVMREDPLENILNVGLRIEKTAP